MQIIHVLPGVLCILSRAATNIRFSRIFVRIFSGIQNGKIDIQHLFTCVLSIAQL